MIDSNFVGRIVYFLTIFTAVELLCFCTHRFTYEDARKRDTVEAYYRFIIENPDADEVDIARERVKDLLFQDCIKTRDVLLIKRFLSEFPLDVRSQKLKEMLDEIRFNTAKEKGNREALYTYLLSSPDGRFRDLAKSLIEEYEYKKLLNSNRVEDIETYLKKYPDGKYRDELYNRATEIYFAKINSNDLKAARDFLMRFAENKYKEAVFKIILDEHLKRANEYCIPAVFYSEMLDDLKKDGISAKTIESFEKDASKGYDQCQQHIDQLLLLSKGRLTDPSIVKRESIVNFKKNMNVFRAYYSMFTYIHGLNRQMLDSDSPAVRLSILNKLKDFPFMAETFSNIIALFFSSTIYERLIIADILVESSKISTNRYLIEQFFFFRRNHKIYEVLSHKVLNNQVDFEELNNFYNRAFSNFREDIVYQFFILLSAYRTGHNGFIRSNINEHLKHLFSITSSMQSMCQATCPQKIYFELKGLNRIFVEELKISRSIFNEDSDIYKVLLKKQKEIEKILNNQKIPEANLEAAPKIPSYDISMYSGFVEKSILKIIYFLEPNLERREQILKFLR